jgi:hypothetical protein
MPALLTVSLYARPHADLDFRAISFFCLPEYRHVGDSRGYRQQWRRSAFLLDRLGMSSCCDDRLLVSAHVPGELASLTDIQASFTGRTNFLSLKEGRLRCLDILGWHHIARCFE